MVGLADPTRVARVRTSTRLARRALLGIACALLASTCAWAQNQPGGAPASVVETPPSAPDITSVQEIARIEGQGENVLRGIGIVTGLKTTGDAGSELLLARPLAQIYERNGNPLPDLRELAKAKSAAIVAIECVIPMQGARVGDNLDVFVTTTHSATSLVGGRLFLAPLMGPLPGSGVYAFASGPLVIEETAIPTVGRIRGGARVVHDVLQPVGADAFTLVVHPHFRSFATTDLLAETINALRSSADPQDDALAKQSVLARAVDDVTVRVTIPESDRANSAKFIAEVLGATFSPSLLRLPAQVIVNQRTGSIVVTGNVEVSAVAIAHKGLVVTTTTPQPIPTPANPLVTASKWTSVQTTDRPSERTRVQELLSAFKALDIPIEEQISILTQIHRAGRLHARLVVE
jgi:flagellar P-ring protein precursor FlgI